MGTGTECLELLRIATGVAITANQGSLLALLLHTMAAGLFEFNVQKKAMFRGSFVLNSRGTM
jgi:hypothetical protein